MANKTVKAEPGRSMAKQHYENFLAIETVNLCSTQVHEAQARLTPCYFPGIGRLSAPWRLEQLTSLGSGPLHLNFALEEILAGRDAAPTSAPGPHLVH